MKQSQFSNPILVNNNSDTIILVKDNAFSNPILLSVEKKEEVFSSKVVEEEVYSRSIWFVLLIFVLLVLISKIKLSFSKLSSNIFASLFRYSVLLKLLKTSNTRNKTGYFLVNILALFTCSVFCFEYFIYKKIFLEPSFMLLLYILLSVFIVVFTKISIVNFIAYIFNSNEQAKEYSFGFLINYKAISFILFPVIIFIPYVPVSMLSTFYTIGIVMIVFAYLLTIIRGIKILFQKHVSVLYLILYLCALEIVPLLLVYKVLYLK